MLLTELVLAISATIAYLFGVCFWLAHRRSSGGPMVVASAHRSFAHEPAVALVGGLPVAAALAFVVFWRLVPALS